MATMGSSRMVSSETISFITCMFSSYVFQEDGFLRIILAFVVSALVAQGWDLMVHLTDEIEYLWK